MFILKIKNFVIKPSESRFVGNFMILETYSLTFVEAQSNSVPNSPNVI